MTLQPNAMPAPADPVACAQDGYLIAPDLFSATDGAAMQSESDAVCRDEHAVVAGLEPALPGESDRDLLVALHGLHHCAQARLGVWPPSRYANSIDSSRSAFAK